MSQATAQNIPLSFYEEKSAYPGIFAWIFSTDHKRIGLLYMFTILSFFLFGMSMGFLIRLEKMFPGGQFFQPATYNALFTIHGVVMIFLFVIPGIPAVFGNFILPIQLGAEDVAFPRLNLLSWWLLVIGALVIFLSLFTGSKLPDTGWTFYAPYNTITTANIPMAVFGAFLVGFSSILTGLNFITTVHRLRAKGMTFFRMPLFAWSIYATAWIQILATPVVGITLLLVIAERFLGVGVFNPSKSGDPLMYQHLFWIYSHPAVYIMVLPAMGIVSDIIPTFCKKPIFGYKAIAFSSMSIAFIGYLVWGHHMFTSGMADLARVVFSFLTFFVAVPTAIKIFNWTATLYKGSIELRAPMLFALSFIFLFSIGGLTGVMLGTLNLDLHLHDTSFVVAHFHYTIFGGFGFALFGGIHYWFPKMFGKMYNETRAKWAWLLLFIGFNMTYFPLFLAGLEGMPRRYYDYLPKFAPYHFWSTIGSWIMISGILFMFGNLLHGLLRGEKADDNPWGGSTLEWQVPSPPPLVNFTTPPVVNKDPYDFSDILKKRNSSPTPQDQEDKGGQ
ncbi:MAG: cytochrome c oxidase subunit I [Planctomycetota bacterium]|nr:MAG: cytochrome c oxidase subunit I [Planctomycetota bacterium]